MIVVDVVMVVVIVVVIVVVVATAASFELSLRSTTTTARMLKNCKNTLKKRSSACRNNQMIALALSVAYVIQPSGYLKLVLPAMNPFITIFHV